MLLNTGREVVPSNAGLLTTVCYRMGNADTIYALEGSIAVTGSAVQWLRDQLGIIDSASEIEALAASVPDNGGMYFVPAFSGLFAPIGVPRTGRHRRALAFQHEAHLARATAGDLRQTRAVSTRW